MNKLPVISYRQLATKLRAAGFELVRTNKHEVYLQRESNLSIPVPHHTGDVPKGLLRAIIRQMNISLGDFLKL